LDGEEYPSAIATSVARLGRAVFFGALHHRGLGFLALILTARWVSSQLGVLIRDRIFFAGLFMCTILFLFVDRAGAATTRWVFFEIVKKYVRWSVNDLRP